MGVEGCTKFIKYLLFFLNFFFWLVGCVILGVALWLRHEPQTSSLLEINFEGQQAPSTFYISVHILIAVGAVIMVVGFLGCYGAIQESQCLLGTFFACLVILFACEVAAGIWGFMHKDTVTKEMINYYDSIYDKAMTQSLNVDTEKKKAAASVLKVFHETLSCCGKGQGTSILTQITDAVGITELCPSSGTSYNCHTRISELFSDKIYLIGIIALAVAVIMIFEMIFSMVLCCGIRNSPVY
ncbi:CD81 antigen-like [Syngnathoides biaculeatus]|uniref:CD81 antigen-like n=1 Tax=Syngnathoides biaculeatus TaxID=300417 RepID=UPI002ADE93F4|nr:CD81 antigen-like [Syngnathoides biaculeatus]